MLAFPPTSHDNAQVESLGRFKEPLATSQRWFCLPYTLVGRLYPVVRTPVPLHGPEMRRVTDGQHRVPPFLNPPGLPGVGARSVGEPGLGAEWENAWSTVRGEIIFVHLKPLVTGLALAECWTCWSMSRTLT